MTGFALWLLIFGPMIGIFLTLCVLGMLDEEERK